MMKIWKNNQSKNIALIITAAGSSTRFGNNIKKEYLPIVENDISKGTVLGKALETFLETNLFSTVVITIPENQQKESEKALSFLPLGKSLVDGQLSKLTSRSDSFETKVNSLALAAVVAEELKKAGN